MSAHAALTKRERQIMDVLYRTGRATAADVLAALPGAPHYSTVRTQLRMLEEKGHVRHESDGLRYVYVPTLARHTARTVAPSIASTSKVLTSSCAAADWKTSARPT